MSRYFIAVEIPENTKKEIASFFYPPLKLEVEGGFVDPEKLHITLLFLGSAEIRHDLVAFLRTLDFSADLKIRGIGAFPSLDSPRVIYAKVHGNLQDKEKSLLSFLGMEKREKFTPHITLCRVKKTIKKIDAGKFEGKEFVFRAHVPRLFSSDLGNYSILS